MLNILVLYSFPLLNCFPLYEFTMCQLSIHPLVDIGLLLVLTFRNNSTMNIYIQFCVCTFSFSWADALGWISWIICKCMLNFLVNCLYSKCTLPFYILSAVCAGSHFFTSSTLLDDVILNFNHFDMCEVVSHCSFDTYF